MDWLKKLVSLEEIKMSALVLSLFACLGIGIFTVLKKGDVPPNLTLIVEFITVTIGGVNAAGWISSNLGNRNSMNSMGMSNNYSNGYNSYGMNNSMMNSNTSMLNSVMGNGLGMNSMNTIPMNNSMMPNSTISPTGQQVVTTSATTSTAANMNRGI